VNQTKWVKSTHDEIKRNARGKRFPSKRIGRFEKKKRPQEVDVSYGWGIDSDGFLVIIEEEEYKK